ncbi:MAG: ATP-binding cassette domain-containing protein [Defluviitaleaceae bacterium]|nr:ATP-binding cassette domain-containing protein [Defluviitaleaceae bacterium]
MLLQCRNLSKSIGADEILRDVSFNLEAKEKAALVGVNGAGKTSVFRLITREWQADGGALTLAAGTRVGYLPQLNESGASGGYDSENGTRQGVTLYAELDSVFDPLKKIEEELRQLEGRMGTELARELDSTMEKYSRLAQKFEERGGYEYSSRVRGVLKGLGFDEDEWGKEIRMLSGGERTRASLGKLLLAAPNLLLLDEPTNHLDSDSVEWLEDYLRAYGGAVVAISHDRYFMDRVVTKTIEIENKKTNVFEGNYTFYAKYKAIGRETAFRHYFQQQKEIKRQEEVIKTLRSFRTEAALIRAKSREKLLDKMERVEKPESLPDKMRLMLEPKLMSGNDVLKVEDVSMGFGNEKLFKGVSFELKRGDRVALIGPNGIGKTTLFKIIMGEISPLSGQITEGVNVRAGYYDQAQQRLSEEKSVFQEIADSYPRLTQTEIRNVLAAFVFTGDDVFKPVKALSGGERGRVSLAKIMLGGANFLVLDEPTNHLDMYSKEILEEALRDFPGTCFYISHDRYFISNTATRIFELKPSGFAVYEGGYEFYSEKKRAAAEALAAAENKGSDFASDSSLSKEARRQKKEAEAEARRSRGRRERLEAKIAEAETQIARLDIMLHEGESASDALAAERLFTEKSELEMHLLYLYGELEESSC